MNRRDLKPNLVPIIVAATYAEALDAAESLNIEAHVRGLDSPGRGARASAVLVTPSAWPLPPDVLSDCLVCIGHDIGNVYLIQAHQSGA